MAYKDKEKQREYDKKRKYRRKCRRCRKKSIGILCRKCFIKGRHGNPSNRKAIKRYNKKKCKK